MCPLSRPLTALLLIGAALLIPSRVRAQEPPPKIGPFAFDVHGTVPHFPNDTQLMNSRELLTREMPGVGLGLHLSANVYLYKWKALTFGLGGDAAVARAHHGSELIAVDTVGRAVTERFTYVAPELSFNFGTGDGWSYLSGGIGRSQWSIVPDGAAPLNADRERHETINYGGGARWFARPHLAFSVDARFYAIYPGSPDGTRPGSPRTTLLIVGAGISVK